MTGVERSLQGIRTSAERLCALERGEAAANEEMIPTRAVLLQEENRLTIWTCARGGTRGVELHERDEAVNLRLVRHERGEHATEAHGVFAERRAHPVITRRGGVTLVEDEIDHLQQRPQTRGALGQWRHLEGDAGLAERTFGAHDALRDRRLGDEKGARDLFGRETSEQPE